MTITKGDHIPVDDQFDILGITESLGRADMATSTPEFRSSSIWAIVPRGASLRTEARNGRHGVWEHTASIVVYVGLVTSLTLSCKPIGYPVALAARNRTLGMMIGVIKIVTIICPLAYHMDLCENLQIIGLGGELTTSLDSQVTELLETAGRILKGKVEVYLVKQVFGKKNPVPYPPGWPLVGNITDMPDVKPWLTFAKWGKKYDAGVPVELKTHITNIFRIDTAVVYTIYIN
ncbi:hypothetical protein C8R48DRAFT_674959 [Suillus tomentosus]|nr:hypothetical protein C8R48DRAFT_674959 [Suillus tomentosus]